jgi:hypothetical protein
MTQNDVIFIGSMPEFYDRHLGTLFFSRMQTTWPTGYPTSGRAHCWRPPPAPVS